MGETVVQDAYPSHVLAYHDSLGFLDRLRHVVTLLLNGVNGEDGQLVELDAVQEGRPGTNSNSLAGDIIHADPGILGVQSCPIGFAGPQ